jgi:hypothetical protein
MKICFYYEYIANLRKNRNSGYGLRKFNRSKAKLSLKSVQDDVCGVNLNFLNSIQNLNQSFFKKGNGFFCKLIVLMPVNLAIIFNKGYN